MAWIDNGRGQWVQQTGEGEINTPKPTEPPPSASGDTRYAGLKVAPGSAADTGEEGIGGLKIGSGTEGEVKRTMTADEMTYDTEEQGRDDAAAAGDLINQEITDTRNEREVQTGDLVNRYGAIQLDKGPAEQARAQQQQILDKLLSYDPNAAAAQAQQRSTQSQLAIARSAPGGAAAKQASMFQALQQAPAIASQAGTDAVRQQQQNTQMASQLVSGTRSQDIDQASREADVGLSAANGIAQVVGRDIQLTSEEARTLGQMQLAIQGLNLDWARMSEQEREARVNEELQRLGLRQQADQFAASQKLTFKDVVGGLMSLGGSAIQGGFTLAAAGQK